jgi:acetyltransferase-like isoleucine patch superfamily enzyme
MERSEDYTVLRVPREGVNDDAVRVVEWLVREGARVEEKQALAVLETSKSTADLEAPAAGYLFPLVAAGGEVPVGAPLALLAGSPSRPAYTAEQPALAAGPAAGGQVISKKARELIAQHGLALTAFTGLAVVRTEDVWAVLDKQKAASHPLGPETEAPLDAVPGADLYGPLQDLLGALRRRMKAKFNRHVSTGSLLSDRWELAKAYGFGEGTSVYDECLILGDVRVGQQCWIGPYTILDGSGGTLVLGDHVDVGSGTHLYTHNTIERALTGGRAPMFKNATTIGSCCFIGPAVVIAPGTVLGDRCFVAAGSYVEGVFPSLSYLAGNPARRVGVVELQGDRARLRRFEDERAGGPDSPSHTR